MDHDVMHSQLLRVILIFVAALLMTACGSTVTSKQPSGRNANTANPVPELELVGMFVDIPAGSFRMGDVVGVGRASEVPIHVVQVSAFRVAQHEVTKGQFAVFVKETDYRTDAERNAGNEVGCKVLDPVDKQVFYRAGRNWRDTGFQQSDSYPVGCISWNDAQAYIRWLNGKTNGRFRLLSEAEWEYVARAGSEAEFPWGLNLNDACVYANVADTTPWPNPSDGQWEALADCNDGHFNPAPVATYRPNKWGVYDMIGNVWEWTEDCWNPTYENAPADASAWRTGDCAQRIFRGGSYDNGHAQLRVPVRFKSTPTLRDLALGFRLAQDQ